jgi:exonuclease III
MVRNENEAASTPGTNPEAANASFTVMLLNVRSVNNKAAALNDYFIDHNPDLICLTETWITEDTPNAVLWSLVPETFELHHCPRPTPKRGGGVGILCKQGIRLTTTKSTRDHPYTQFEHMELRMKRPQALTIIVMYRPPPTRDNGATGTPSLTRSASFWNEQHKDQILSSSLAVSTYTWTEDRTWIRLISCIS